MMSDNISAARSRSIQISRSRSAGRPGQQRNFVIIKAGIATADRLRLRVGLISPLPCKHDMSRPLQTSFIMLSFVNKRKHNKPRLRVARRGIARFLGIDQKCNQVVPWSLRTFPENFMQIGPAVSLVILLTKKQRKKDTYRRCAGSNIISCRNVTTDLRKQYYLLVYEFLMKNSIMNPVSLLTTSGVNSTMAIECMFEGFSFIKRLFHCSF